MKVLLAGASGTLGVLLSRRLVGAGHQLSGITRTRQGAELITQLGGSPILADVLDRDALLTAVSGHRFDAIVHELTALKKAPLRHRDMHQTNVLRTVGTRHLIEVAHTTQARRFVTQSIVFGYGYADHGTTPLTEDSPFAVTRGDAFDPHLEAMRSTEQQAIASPNIDGVALRYGLFYGADNDKIAGMLRKRALPVVRGGGEIPFIHQQDAADATVAAVERGVPGQVYNVVDDTPATFAQLLDRIAEATGTPRPLRVPWPLLSLAVPYGKVIFKGVSMRVANERAKKELSWTPAYASIHQGVPSTG